ncbi:MAG: hypothetical protein EBZ77_07760 [Chitinophagia bacterium]|nr:hypothetical protein [Chitinophagia bacterium]
MKPKFSLFVASLLTIVALGAHGQSRKIMTFAGSGGTGGFSGDGFVSTAAVLHGPVTLSADRFGNVYIVDFYNFRVRKVKANGSIVTFAGTGSFGAYRDSTVASSADIRPLGVAADGRGNVYISEPSYNVVYKVNTRGIITTYAGSDTFGYSGDGGKARKARLALPYG